MTVLKYDNVIKNSLDLGTILVFLKNLMWYHTHTKFHSQGLTGSGFMTDGPFMSPRLFNVKKSTIKTLMTINSYRPSVNGCFCVLENSFLNIPKIVIFLSYKDSEEHF